MSVYSVVSPFRQLLNQISHDLRSQNLRSLLYICGSYVSENQRENIRCGIDLFECLIHCNIIGEELVLMGNLLSLMRQMRPKRKDIIRTVKRHIREHYEPPWGFESSVESSLQSTTGTNFPVIEQPSTPLQPHTTTYQGSSGSSTPLISHSNEQYSWCCICFDCNCIPRPVPSCVLVIGFIVFAVLTIIVTIIWFAKIPTKWHDGLGELKDTAVGASIVAITALISLVFLIVFIVRKVEHMRARRQYHQLSINRAIVSSADNITVTSGSISSLPVDTTVKRYKPKRRRSDRSTLPTDSETSHVVIPPVAIPSRQTNTQLSYPDGCHDNITDEDGTSGNYASQSDFYSGEESEVPTVAVSG